MSISGSMVVRGVPVLAGGVGIAFGLFLIMALLIGSEHEFSRPESGATLMHFIRVKELSSVETRSRERPPEPQPQAEPPPPSRPQISSVPNPSTPALNIDVPSLNIPLGIGDGPMIGGGSAIAPQGSELLPLVRIEPQYPRQAAMAGIEGWVKVRFDISEDGSVANIEVLEASPRNTFNRSAEQALLRWKFRPMEVDGRAIRVEGYEVTIDFKLNR